MIDIRQYCGSCTGKTDLQDPSRLCYILFLALESRHSTVYCSELMGCEKRGAETEPGIPIETTRARGWELWKVGKANSLATVV